jgi:hypothetical protein
MTVLGNTHYLRPQYLQGAALKSQSERIRRLLRLGLLRDDEGRTLVELDPKEAELRLKARTNEE